MKNCLVILFVIGIFLTGCENQIKKDSSKNSEVIIPSVEISRNDSLISMKNGIVYYGDKLFSGVLTEDYLNGKRKSRTEYYKGNKYGKEFKWYSSGKLYTERYYINGMKNGMHTGYWENGNKKFEYNFTDGSYDGSFKEWYEEGNIAVWLNYKNGIEDGSQKGWRDNGKLYINYVVKNGKAYGVVKSRLCYSVKNGQGQYSSSIISGNIDSSAVTAILQR